MIYPAPDGHLINSSPDGPVTYTCPSPDSWPQGTYESFETSSKPDNSLEQIKIVRTVNNGEVQITVTERTPQEIQDYLNTIN